MKTPGRIDLNLYRVFDAIYQEGSLTRAGEVLHMTQPAVSNALARLREAYDDPLFVRRGRGVSPTPLGESLASDIAQALRLLGSGRAERATFDPARTDRRFRIGAGDMSSALVLPAVLEVLAGTAIRIEVQSYSRRQLVHALASGEIDLALDALPAPDPQLQAQKLTEDAFVCAVRPGHTALTRRLTLPRYLALGHVHASGRPRGLGQVDMALRRLGEQRRIVVRTAHHLALPYLVRSSDLAASIPRRIADAHHLAIRPLPFDIPPLEVHAIWHRRSAADAATAWFRGLLADALAGGATRAGTRREQTRGP
ncbi:MAG: LysR family transcriptional regulator [Gammaproteobacteria bacterium]